MIFSITQLMIEKMYDHDILCYKYGLEETLFCPFDIFHIPFITVYTNNSIEAQVLI